jgi:adhesin transport system outer membrane protein
MKRRLSLALVPFLVPVVGFGLTLEEAVKHVNATNPVIMERIKNFEATRMDIDMAQSGYYPSIDFEAKYGPEMVSTSTIPEIHMKRYERGIKATMNLFQGFGTSSDVKKQEARTEAAKNSVLEKANALGLQTVEAYLNLMKQHAFLKIAQENLKTHEEIHGRINERTESGFGSKSEQDQSKGRLSLAQSNFVVQQSNYRDALAKFTRLYGEEVDPNTLVKPTFGYALPVTLESAVQKARAGHPAIGVQQANIHAAKQNAVASNAAYYPRLDAELAKYNNDNVAGTPGYHDTRSAMLILSYNLYGGGYYQANREKQEITTMKEEAILGDLQRSAEENVKYAWIAYEEIGKQIPHLKAHRDYSITTLDAYNKEFSLGRRTLLDILNTENERTSAEQELANAEYDLLLAKYRILEGTGELVGNLNAEPSVK